MKRFDLAQPLEQSAFERQPHSATQARRITRVRRALRGLDHLGGGGGALARQHLLVGFGQ
jgi:hypothetical protein